MPSETSTEVAADPPKIYIGRRKKKIRPRLWRKTSYVQRSKPKSERSARKEESVQIQVLRPTTRMRKVAQCVRTHRPGCVPGNDTPTQGVAVGNHHRAAQLTGRGCQTDTNTDDEANSANRCAASATDAVNQPRRPGPAVYRKMALRMVRQHPGAHQQACRRRLRWMEGARPPSLRHAACLDRQCTAGPSRKSGALHKRCRHRPHQWTQQPPRPQAPPVPLSPPLLSSPVALPPLA